MVTILCVLKVSDEYVPRHVMWLKRQVEANVTVPHRFVCLSDVALEGCEWIPHRHKWPGFWSKIEVFRPDLGLDKVFFLDLDTVITGNIDHIVTHQYRFAAMKNLSPRINGIGSAAMAWDNSAYNTDHIYERFAEFPEFHMAQNNRSGTPFWGDQGYIGSQVHGIDYMQDLFPGAIQGYHFKGGIADVGLLPETKLAIFFGKPRPWDRNLPFLPRV